MRVLMLGALLSAAPTCCLPGWRPRARCNGADRRGLADNLAGGIASAAFIAYLQPDQRELLGHAVRAVQLDDAAAAQVGGGLFGRLRRRLWLRQFFASTALLGLPVLLVGMASKAKSASSA
jgi:PAT family beta-lactamase induction signal transducer AmpG